MGLISFEEAKAGRQPEKDAQRHLMGQDKGVLELQKQYQELVRFYERWYDEHVVGQDESGAWVYK